MKCPYSFIIDAPEHALRQNFYGMGKHLESPTTGRVVPCGKCLICRHNRSAEWAIRLSHELESYKDATFLTLTYTQEEVPISDFGITTLKKEDVIKFIKRLRKKISPKKIKYFLVGEYGTKTNRPHYHIIIFGWKPERKDLEKIGGYFKSGEMSKTWGKGNVIVGSVEANSIYYVAGYMVKDNYITDLELVAKEEQYMSCSKGIGEEYVKNNTERIKELDVTKNGKPYAIPRYYIKKLKTLGVKLNRNKVIRQDEEKELAIIRMMENKNKISKELTALEYDLLNRRKKELEEQLLKNVEAKTRIKKENTL